MANNTQTGNTPETTGKALENPEVLELQTKVTEAETKVETLEAEIKELKEKQTTEVKTNKVITKTFTVEKNVIKKDKEGNVVINKKGEAVFERIKIKRVISK